MTKDQLIRKLNAMRAKGEADRRKVAMTQLFGLIFDEEIGICSNARELAREAGCKAAEMDINAGRNLTPYVTVKPEIRRSWGAG